MAKGVAKLSASKIVFDNRLYYGDNLEVLRKYIDKESIDLCYIDPPFNSKRNYNQIYNNIGKEDKAQAQAFIDTWEWDDKAIQGYQEILGNINNIFTKQTILLIKGLKSVLGDSALLSYIISMTLRIAEIYRVLKPTGSFYLHCDPTASHYLKIVLDSIFVPNGGEYQNEIIWHYGQRLMHNKYKFNAKHDIIFYYTKSCKTEFKNQVTNEWTKEEIVKTRVRKIQTDEDGKEYIMDNRAISKGIPAKKQYIDDIIQKGKAIDDVWDIPFIPSTSAERLGYPTQKPEAILERIIKASSNKGDIVLDAYCGCGTTVAVAQRMGRKWIGIDITYQSISVILKRLKEHFGEEVLDKTELNGIPKDMESAKALTHKVDDRVRKEFEKWAVLTYSDNKAIINEKKGADSGIDGITFMLVGNNEHEQVLFSVKSGHVGVNLISEFCHVVNREKAAMGIFITLEKPTTPMIKEAKNMGNYTNPLTQQNYPKIEIVTIEEMLGGKRLNLPQAVNVLKEALKKKGVAENQLGLDF